MENALAVYGDNVYVGSVFDQRFQKQGTNRFVEDSSKNGCLAVHVSRIHISAKLEHFLEEAKVGQLPLCA